MTGGRRPRTLASQLEQEEDGQEDVEDSQLSQRAEGWALTSSPPPQESQDAHPLPETDSGTTTELDEDDEKNDGKDEGEIDEEEEDGEEEEVDEEDEEEDGGNGDEDDEEDGDSDGTSKAGYPGSGEVDEDASTDGEEDHDWVDPNTFAPSIAEKPPVEGGKELPDSQEPIIDLMTVEDEEPTLPAPRQSKTTGGKGMGHKKPLPQDPMSSSPTYAPRLKSLGGVSPAKRVTYRSLDGRSHTKPIVSLSYPSSSMFTNFFLREGESWVPVSLWTRRKIRENHHFIDHSFRHHIQMPQWQEARDPHPWGPASQQCLRVPYREQLSRVREPYQMDHSKTCSSSSKRN